MRQHTKRVLTVLLTLVLLMSLLPAASADGEAGWLEAEILEVSNYSHYYQTGQYYEGAFVLWKQNVLLNGTPIETEGGAVNYSDEDLAALGIQIVWTDSDGQAAVIDYDSPNTHYFGGPARVGQYTVKVTQTIGNETQDISEPYSFTVTPTFFYKFTDYSYLESGARYYLYSIMGEMDGQLYAMAMPGRDIVYKQAAIPVWPDEGGGIPLGYNRENIFMLTWDPHTVDGHYLYHLTTGTALDIFFAGSPNGGIGRGRRNLTGDEGFYIDTDPYNNYDATIYEPNIGRGRFLLAKDSGGNIFFTRAVYSTGEPNPNLGITQTAPVYLYWNHETPEEPSGGHTYEFLGEPYDKVYDGEPIDFDEYKNICVDGGKTDWGSLVKNGEARLVWRQWMGKEQVEIEGPPSAVGQYAVVIQEPGKGGGKEDFGGKGGKEDGEVSGDPDEAWIDAASSYFEITAAQAVSFNVTFYAGVGSVSIQQVTAGEKAVRPADPTQDGWWFGGWYADEALTARFDFDTAITADTDVYAKWVQPDFVLPEGLTSIEAEAFRGCAFTFVKLPDGIASVEEHAFADCPYLAYIEIPGQTVEIDPNAFGTLQGLTIYGPPRSPAAAFAAENGYTFVMMN